MVISSVTSKKEGIVVIATVSLCVAVEAIDDDDCDNLVLETYFCPSGKIVGSHIPNISDLTALLHISCKMSSNGGNACFF